MKFWIIFPLLLVAFISPAHAQNCWFGEHGVRCAPGWGWRDGREWSEQRREEWWRERRRHDEEEHWRRHDDSRWRQR